MSHELDTLKKAAQRVWDWEEHYGIHAEWKIEPAGLALWASKDGLEADKHVDWEEFESFFMPTLLLRKIEGQMLEALGQETAKDWVREFQR